MPIQASWTTSSATAWDETYICAKRTIEGWFWSTSIMNVASSPASSRSIVAASADGATIWRSGMAES